MRFIFQPGSPLGVRGDGGESGYHAPAAPLLVTLRDFRFLMFVGVWIGLNALFGFGTLPMGLEQGQEVAWQAHLGGFFAGLVLFDAFDPIRPQRELDTEAPGP